MTESLLRLDDVDAGYRDLQVLRGVSLDVPAGTIEAVLGRNGVGKTTLLSTIAGLLRASRGRVMLGGEEVQRRPAHRRSRDGIALVQEGKRVFHRRTVMENVVLGTYGRRLARTQRRDAALEVLSHFPMLDDRHDHRAGGLSGGQQQMLAIAQALAAEPRLLLLDEPSAGLAPSVVAEVFTQIQRLRDRGMTVLLVEQLADLALDIADHVTVIDNGSVVAAGAPGTFRDRAGLHEAYFGRAPIKA